MKMTTRQKHWLFFIITAIGAIVVVNLAILLMWTDMTEEEREFGRAVFGRVVIYGTLAMVVLFFISSQFILYIFRNYISPIEVLTEETRLITLANAKYRIKPVGALETNKLTTVINDLADSYISLKSDVKEIVTESKEGFEEDKIRLATFMNMADKGVIICDQDARIAMANKSAYEIINSVEHEEVGRFARLGVGRSIFSIFNKAPIAYIFERIHDNVDKEDAETTFHFITTRYKKQFIRVSISPTVKANETIISGYIFTFKDVTEELAQQSIAYNDCFILLDELTSIANMKTNNRFNITPENGVWVNIQERQFVDLLLEVLERGRLRKMKELNVNIVENYTLALKWDGDPFPFRSSISKFEDKITVIDDNDRSLTVSLNAYKQVSENIVSDHVESRPVHYSSENFDQSVQHNELDDIPLEELSYVVFDTETTGLDPSSGHEIISIAGVRVYNNKINHEEMFDELVNPKRSISLKSIQIHEIHPEMLTDKLTIDKVLPHFSEYVDRSVLVAHNAAFDMRFIQLKEEQSGVKFTNPVLDTLLLSAVCHPKQELHNLEDIASRLGIELVGRHTALGDAIVTAEIFLKLIPILKAKGIHTLGQAREASSRTTFAKITF